MIVRPAERGLLVKFDTAAVPSRSDLLYGSGCLFLTLTLVFGGGTQQGLWSDALIEVAALPVLLLAIWNLRPHALTGAAPYGFLLALLVLLIPLLELIPLPPFLWHLLPGRAHIAEELSLVGLDRTFQPITLAPRECWMMFLALLPPATLFFVTAGLGRSRRRTLIVIFLAWICAGVGLTFMQMASGPASVFRFYADTNLYRGVGFFANANHNALALSIAVLFVILSPYSEKPERASLGRILVAASLLISIVVAIALTQSRAGIGLVFLALTLGGAVVLRRAQKGRQRRRYLVAAICLAAIGAFAVFEAGFLSMSDRFESSLAGDFRLAVLRAGYDAMLQFLPVGSGLGSFVSIYERFAPVSLVHMAYVNHAHNDWLELLIELGVLWPMIAIAFALWVGVTIWQQWRKHGAAVLKEMSLCLMALVLMALASAVDYPLRTIALMSVFGVICGFLIEPPERVAAE